MKKIFLGIITIAMVTGLMVGGALAYFSDTETSARNAFTAGSLDLKVDGYDDPISTYFNVSDAAPGSSNGARISLANVGTINGTAAIQLNLTSDLENSLTEPELELRDTAADGELDENLIVTITNGGTTVVSDALSVINGTEYSLGPLPAGGSITLGITCAVPSEVGNIIQTDSCAFNMVFTLRQA